MIRVKIFGDEQEVEEIAKALINHAVKNEYGIAVGKAHRLPGQYFKQVVMSVRTISQSRNKKITESSEKLLENVSKGGQ